MEYLGTLNNRLKTVINKILARLLGSKFEPDNIIKSKVKKFIIKKKYCLIISSNGNLILLYQL